MNSLRPTSLAGLKAEGDVMLRLIICGVGLAALGGTAAAAARNEVAAARQGLATCDAKYYGYLVGKSLQEARSVNGDYRVVTQGSARGEAKPKRMTVVYDAGSNQIVEVACG